MTRLTDTSPEAEEVLREVYRRMSFAQRWRTMGSLYQTARMLHAAGYRMRKPEATDEEIQDAWAVTVLGDSLAGQVRRKGVVGNSDQLRVLKEVTDILDRLHIAYALGGSWASSMVGKMRFTNDADVCVEPFPGKETAFCDSFGADYYVSLPAVRQALQTRSCFNVIHGATSFKVDLFVSKGRPFDLSLMARRRSQIVPESGGQAVTVVSPEDVILLKLEWYRLGEELSEQQWRDILGVFEIQGKQLDLAYLEQWAADLRVADLLARARKEAGL